MICVGNRLGGLPNSSLKDGYSNGCRGLMLQVDVYDVQML
jgi:hypothetical protein